MEQSYNGFNAGSFRPAPLSDNRQQFVNLLCVALIQGNLVRQKPNDQNNVRA